MPVNHSLYSSKLEEGLSVLQCELVAERNKENPNNITWFQYDLLESLYHSKGSLPAQLSCNLGVSRSKVSKALKGLKDIGYIHQIQGTGDGREFFTQLTKDGLSFLNSTKAGHRHLEQTASAVLTPSEQELFAEFCLRVAQAFQERRKSNE
ncbi:hypothetical protein YDYSY3_55910 [Paenibacillus chitinolyticus]|nr:hypothetical protein YDYSY3_55910 [Paenibacillus chitinolyticus]